jgi:heme iron utilization protein
MKQEKESLMSSTEEAQTRRHASSPAQAPGQTQEQPAEPSFAERVRTLVSLHAIATLSTLSRKRAGYPFGSLMPYALDAAGRPLFLISSMAMHTQNLKADPRASLFVGEAADGDPLGAARATLIGDVVPVPEAEVGAARASYLARHENSRSWVDFEDFGFYRLQPVDIYYVGGFGVMGWVAAAEYEVAQPDPLAESAAGILSHINHDHVPAMLVLARRYAGIEAQEAAMTAVDRLGFFLKLKTAGGMKGVRINYPHEVRSSQETRQALVEMVRAAEPAAGSGA